MENNNEEMMEIVINVEQGGALHTYCSKNYNDTAEKNSECRALSKNIEPIFKVSRISEQQVSILCRYKHSSSVPEERGYFVGLILFCSNGHYRELLSNPVRILSLKKYMEQMTVEQMEELVKCPWIEWPEEIMEMEEVSFRKNHLIPEVVKVCVENFLVDPLVCMIESSLSDLIVPLLSCLPYGIANEISFTCIDKLKSQISFSTLLTLIPDGYQGQTKSGQTGREIRLGRRDTVVVSERSEDLSKWLLSLERDKIKKLDEHFYDVKEWEAFYLQYRELTNDIKNEDEDAILVKIERNKMLIWLLSDDEKKYIRKIKQAHCNETRQIQHENIRIGDVENRKKQSIHILPKVIAGVIICVIIAGICLISSQITFLGDQNLILRIHVEIGGMCKTIAGFILGFAAAVLIQHRGGKK